jgi:spermidine synthase
VALALEVIWTRALIFSFFQGSSTYAFTAMLTIFLLGLGAGSFIAAPFVDRIGNPVRLFGWMEVLIGLFAAISLPLLLHLGREHVSEPLGTSWLLGMSQDFFKSFLVMIVPTFVMGAAFPVFTRIYVTHVRAVSRGVGSLYSLNTLGAILGSFSAGFVLVPLLGMARGLSILSALSMLAGAAILLLDRQSPVRSRIAAATVPAVCIAAVLFLAPAQARFQQVGEDQEILYYREGSNGTVSVVQMKDESRWVVIDNVWVAGTSLGMMTDQKSLAHIPALFHRDPKRVLTVGFGSGGASWSFSTHESLEEIHCVELAPEVVDAHSYFPDCNFTLFEDDRYRIIFDDAKSYLLLGEPEYDTISTDCTDLRYKSNADLYTLDYFLTCKRKLRDDGLLVVWMPLTGLTEHYYRVVLSTFTEAFPNGTLWYFTNYITNYILLIGSEEPLVIDWQAMSERLNVSAVRQDLAMIHLDDPYKLVSAFLMDAPTLREFVQGYALNTDDLPLVEFGVPKSPPVDFMNNLAITMRFQGRAIPPVANVPDEEREGFEATLARYVDAGRYLSRGHIHYWRNEKDAARHLYLKALALTPEDESLRMLLGLSAEREQELLTRVQANPDDPGPGYDLALLHWETGRRDEALARLEALGRSNPEFLSASLGLGRRLHELGRHEEAARILDALLVEARGGEAETVVRRVIEVGGHLQEIGRSQDDEPVLELANLLLGYGDLYEAIGILERETEKRRSVPLLDRLAYLYLVAGLTDDVERAARIMLEEEPERPEAHYYLAQVHLRWNELEEAEAEFLSAVSADEQNAYTWYLGAIIHHRQGKESEAAAALRKAFDLGGSELVERARRDPVLEGSPILEEALGGAG